MKLYKTVAWLMSWVILLGIPITPAQAAPPTPPVQTPPAGEAGDEADAIRPASAVLDLTGASNIGLPAGSPAGTLESAQANQTFPPNPMVVAEHDGKNFKIVSGDFAEIEPGASSENVSAANVTTIVSEDFESPLSSPPWANYDNNGTTGGFYSWARVNCYSATGFPLGSFGNASMWVAGAGTPQLDPCQGDSYPKDLDAWLVYGPFSLVDAKSAFLDFYFWLDNGGDSDDFLFWGVSTDADPFTSATFHGEAVSGTYNAGPFINSSSGGHNFVSLDLTQVPTLGDVTGESKVWIGFRFVSDGDDQVGLGAFIDSVTIRKNPGTKQTITVENFDSGVFPDGYVSWLGHDNNGATGGEARWGSAECFARSGSQSVWTARNGANGLDPCAGSFSYPPSMDSWLIYGPFNLQNASEAWIDFYFRNDSEPGGDFITWFASKNGTNYHGFGISSTFTKGPHNNGYNRMQLDLSNVPTLGDLRGEATVWLAFIFNSDSDANSGQGPFIDDVSVVMIDKGSSNSLFLPLVIHPEPVSVGGLTFQNLTGNPVIIQLIGIGTRTFPGTPGPHVWADIPAGTYDWIASGTCPAGAGQVGSLPPTNRQKVTIIPDKLDNPINVENGGKFDCNG